MGVAKAERANAANRVAGQFERLVRPQHPRPRAELGLAFAIGQAGVAARHQQEGEWSSPHRQCLGDPRWLNAQSPGGIQHGRRAAVGLDQPHVAGMLGEPGLNRFGAHSPTR